MFKKITQELKQPRPWLLPAYIAVIALIVSISVVYAYAQSNPTFCEMYSKAVHADSICPVGSSNVYSGTLGLQGGTNFTITLSGTPTAARTQTLQDNTGVLPLSSAGYSLFFTNASSTVLALPPTGTGTLATVSNTEAFTNKTYNGLTVTSSTGTLTISNGKTLTASDSTTLDTNAITFAGTEALTLTAAKNVTFADAFTTSGSNPITLTSNATSSSFTLPTGTGATEVVVGRTSTDELTNKTLTSSVGKGTWTASGTWTLPAFTLGGTVTATGQTISSPTLTTPVINTAAHVGGSWVADATWTLPAFTLGGTLTINGQALSGTFASNILASLSTNGDSGAFLQNPSTGASARNLIAFGDNLGSQDVFVGVLGGNNTSLGGARSGFLATGSTAPFVFAVNNTEVARIDSNSRLSVSAGIAPASPLNTEILGVYKNGSASAVGIFAGVSSAAGGQLILGHARGTIASPTTLSVDDGLGYLTFDGYNNAWRTSIAYIAAKAATGWAATGTDTPSRLELYTTPDGSSTAVERLRITSAGVIATGAATPTNITATGSGYFTGGVAIGADSLNNLIDDASGGTGSTTLYIGNSSIDVTVSDARLKNVLGPSSQNALAQIAQLPIVDYTWKAQAGELANRPSNGPWVGMTAQALYNILPQYVLRPQGDGNTAALLSTANTKRLAAIAAQDQFTAANDAAGLAEKNKNPNAATLRATAEALRIAANQATEDARQAKNAADVAASNWSINYQYMVPLAFKGIQELKAENDSLKARVAALEAKVR